MDVVGLLRLLWRIWLLDWDGGRLRLRRTVRLRPIPFALPLGAGHVCHDYLLRGRCARCGLLVPAAAHPETALADRSLNPRLRRQTARRPAKMSAPLRVA